MKAKSLIAGLLIGAISTTTVSVAAQNIEIQAWLIDNTVLNINGKNKELPDGMHIINYKDRAYVPVRFIAEEMGGVVNYDEKNEKIVIKTPKSVGKPVETRIPTSTPAPLPVETPIATPTPLPVETPIATPTPIPNIIQYHQPPVKLSIEDIDMYIYGMFRGFDSTYINLDVKNKNSRSCIVDYEKAYIQVDGIKYPAKLQENTIWSSSIQNNSSVGTIIDGNKVINAQMVFEEIPEDKYKMTIVIPVLLDTYSYEKGESQKELIYKIAVDFTDK